MEFGTSARRTFLELGLIDGLLYALKRILGRCSRRLVLHKYYLLAQPVHEQPRLPAHRGQNILVRRLESDDPLAYGFGRSEQAVRQRYEQGAVCFGAFSGDRLVGYLWLVLGPYVEDEVRCRFVPLPAGRVSWDFDIYLDPRHRFGLAFARLWDAADAYLREHGVVWTMSRISAFNPGSLAAHQRQGALRLGSVIFLSLARCQVMLATIRPYLDVACGGDRLPEIELRLRSLREAAAR